MAFERGLRIDSWLRQEREAVGMTQVELAEAIGCQQPHISNLETGRTGVKSARLRRIREALDARRKAAKP